MWSVYFDWRSFGSQIVAVAKLEAQKLYWLLKKFFIPELTEGRVGGGKEIILYLGIG